MFCSHTPFKSLTFFFQKHSRTIGFSINGFKFVFSGDEFLKKLITLPPDLINKPRGTDEEMFAAPKEIFKLSQEKLVETALRNYRVTINN